MLRINKQKNPHTTRKEETMIMTNKSNKKMEETEKMIKNKMNKKQSERLQRKE